MKRAECKPGCRLHLVILIRRNSCTLLKNLVVGKLCAKKYLLVVGRLDVDGQSFAPIGLHKTDAASDWLRIKRHCIGKIGLPGVQFHN